MIDIDTVKALKVKKLFTLYATGKYPLHSLAKWSDKNNLRAISVKNLLSPISIKIYKIFSTLAS